MKTSIWKKFSMKCTATEVKEGDMSKSGMPPEFECKKFVSPAFSIPWGGFKRFGAHVMMMSDVGRVKKPFFSILLQRTICHSERDEET